jgi:hypothetical protein
VGAVRGENSSGRARGEAVLGGGGGIKMQEEKQQQQQKGEEELQASY